MLTSTRTALLALVILLPTATACGSSPISVRRPAWRRLEIAHCSVADSPVEHPPLALDCVGSAALRIGLRAPHEPLWLSRNFSSGHDAEIELRTADGAERLQVPRCKVKGWDAPFTRIEPRELVDMVEPLECLVDPSTPAVVLVTAHYRPTAPPPAPPGVASLEAGASSNSLLLELRERSATWRTDGW